MKKSIAVILMIMVGLLTGCAEKPGNQSEKNGSIATTPTITPTNTPTAISSPTPIPHKTKQEVAEELKNVKVSVDDLMNEDVVYPTYFGAVDDNLTDEILKRTSYFESKGLSFNQAKALVVYLNYCYLNSDAVDKDKADNYLSILNKYNNVEMRRIHDQITEHNAKYDDDQIVLSWCMIDQNDKDGRAVINNKQQEMTKALINGESFNDIFSSTDNKYDVSVKQNDGSLRKLTGLYDDLNIAVKYADISIQYSGIGYILDNYYSDAFYEAGAPIANDRELIFPAFSDPEHANVRRHGFDANSFYEEDLQ